MKLVFLDMKTIGPVPNEHILDRFGEVAYYQTTTAEETWDRVKDADVIITSKVILNRDLIGRAETLKMICIAATGMNNVDREAANNRGIPVKNVSGYSTNSVAQGTFALLLHL